MAVRCLPQSLTQDLNVFAERISELLLNPLVRETPLRAPHHLAVAFHTFGGLPILNEDLIAPVDQRVDRTALYELLRILRFFELQNEPANVGRIVDRLRREPIEDTMRRGAMECLKEFSLKHMPEHLTSVFPDGTKVGPREAFDLYLNGEIFHSDLKKRKRWQALKNSQFEPILYSTLLQAGVAKANAVVELYRLLRVHGHIQPVQGDPTYVS
jgi:hypothetical protein